MKNELLTLHEIAMEFVDEARLAKQHGDVKTTRLFLQKALNLEKIVALGTPKSAKYQLTRTVFFRSAATLAVESGCYEEALQLIETALTSNPHPALTDELKALALTAQQQQNNIAIEQKEEITGRLVAADLPKHQIKIQLEQADQYLLIEVPSELLLKIVTSYWEQLITIESVIQADGSAYLKEVRQAA